MQQARGDGRLCRCVGAGGARPGTAGFEEALDGAGAARSLADPEILIARLPDALGLAPEETEAEIERRILEDGLHWRDWKAIAGTMAQGKGTTARRRSACARRSRWRRTAIASNTISTSSSPTKGEIRAASPLKAVEKIDSSLPSASGRSRPRSCLACRKSRHRAREPRSAAIIRLPADVPPATRSTNRRGRSRFRRPDHRYARSARADDARAAGSITSSTTASITFSSTRRRDTSAAQWQILQSLAAEFTTGSGRDEGGAYPSSPSATKSSRSSPSRARAGKIRRNAQSLFHGKARDAGKAFEPVATSLLPLGQEYSRSCRRRLAQPHALDG